MLDELLKHLKEITINLHVHYHGDNETLHLLRQIHQQGETIMATQKELADRLNVVSDELAKVGGETVQLVTDVAALKEIIANGPANPELTAAVEKVELQAKKVDDMVPDPLPPA